MATHNYWVQIFKRAWIKSREQIAGLWIGALIGFVVAFLWICLLSLWERP